MLTRMHQSEADAQGTGGHAALAPSHLTTTLYDLITVLQDVAGADDALVAATMVHLVQSGQLSWAWQSPYHAQHGG